MKTWLKTILCVLLLAAIGTLVWWLRERSVEERMKVLCNAMEIELSGTCRCLDIEDIRTLVAQRYGAWTGQSLSEVDLDKIESILSHQSTVEKADAWVTGDGALHLKVLQRTPVARLGEGPEGCYTDAGGHLFPLSDKWEADVPLFAGTIPGDPKWLAGALEFVGFISGEWRQRIDEINVTRSGELVLRLDGGGEDFLFGGFDRIEEKMAAADNYISSVRPLGKGYTSVNLKYSKQLICK